LSAEIVEKGRFFFQNAHFITKCFGVLFIKVVKRVLFDVWFQSRALELIRVVFVFPKKLLPFLDTLLVRRWIGLGSEHFPFAFWFVRLDLDNSPLDDVCSFEKIFNGAHCDVFNFFVVTSRVFLGFVLRVECSCTFHYGSRSFMSSVDGL
jgi:hypothetical protein